MDAITYIGSLHADASDDTAGRDLVEIDAAISLVAQGLATRVQLVGLDRPEMVASTGLAHAQAARVGFSLDRGWNGAVGVTVGPRR